MNSEILGWLKLIGSIVAAIVVGVLVGYDLRRDVNER